MVRAVAETIAYRMETFHARSCYFILYLVTNPDSSDMVKMQRMFFCFCSHLKNPEIASKIQKLIEAGFISLR